MSFLPTDDFFKLQQDYKYLEQLQQDTEGFRPVGVITKGSQLAIDATYGSMESANQVATQLLNTLGASEKIFSVKESDSEKGKFRVWVNRSQFTPAFAAYQARKAESEKMLKAITEVQSSKEEIIITDPDIKNALELLKKLEQIRLLNYEEYGKLVNLLETVDIKVLPKSRFTFESTKNIGVYLLDHKALHKSSFYKKLITAKTIKFILDTLSSLK